MASAETSGSVQRRHWADVLTIFTGLALMALAIWPGDQSASVGAEREADNPLLLWGAHAFAGAAAIAAVFIAQKWSRRPIARTLLVLGALALLAVLVFFNDFGPRALLTSLLPAVLLLVASTSIGPMPRDLHTPESGNPATR